MRSDPQTQDLVKNEAGTGGDLSGLFKATLGEHPDRSPPWDFSMDVQKNGGQVSGGPVSMPDGGRYGVEVWVDSPRCGGEDDKDENGYCGLAYFSDAVSLMFENDGRVACRISMMGVLITEKVPENTAQVKAACWWDGERIQLWVNGAEKVAAYTVLEVNRKDLTAQSDEVLMGGKGQNAEKRKLGAGSIALVRVWKSVQALERYVDQQRR